MEKRISLYPLVVLLCFSVLIVPFQTQAFIERHYRLEEVLKACTNIVFGTVTSVNRKRMTTSVKVEENIKGKSDFQEIKMNLGFGQGNFPQKMIKQFKVGLPIIIFYAKEGERIDSLGHVNGTWFQTHAHNQSNKSRVWWNFTHIEIYMHRTYKGSTPAFQKLLRDILAGKTRPTKLKISEIQTLAKAPSGAVRVLALAGNRFDVEFPTLSDVDRVGEHRVVYQKTKDRNLPNLEYAHLLWIGQGEISESKYLLTTEQEDKIKAFVQRGGVVIVSGQDSDDGRPCGTGWIPEPMEGVERWGRNDFQPTRAAGRLFSEPNTITSGEVFIEDTWTGWSDKYTILATTNGGKEIAVAMLKHGEGMYLVTSFQNETSANVFVNRPIMENLVHFAVKWLMSREIQTLVQAPSGAVRVLVFTGDRDSVEFPILSDVDLIGERRTIYQETKDQNLLNLGQADILWIGQGAIGEGHYRLTTEQENKIKAFVKRGGVVIASGQDCDANRPCGTGWIPEPMKGVERHARSDFHPTRAAGTLLTEPNVIKSGEVFIDDTWTDWNDKYVILATTNGGKDIVIAMLRYGTGMYLVTSFRNETSANVFVNRPMIENLIHFAVEWYMNRS